MSRVKAWQTVKSSLLIDHTFLRLVEDVLVHPEDDRTMTYRYLSGGQDSVATVALTNRGKIVLTRQYRHPVKAIIYDLPAGKIEPGETWLQAARRELQEETGYIAGHIEPLTRYNQFPGAVQTGIRLFFADHLKPGPPSPDEFEEIEVVELSVPETLTLILNNQTIDGSLMLGILYAYQKGLLKTDADEK